MNFFKSISFNSKFVDYLIIIRPMITFYVTWMNFNFEAKCLQCIKFGTTIGWGKGIRNEKNENRNLKTSNKISVISQCNSIFTKLFL